MIALLHAMRKGPAWLLKIYFLEQFQIYRKHQEGSPESSAPLYPVSPITRKMFATMNEWCILIRSIIRFNFPAVHMTHFLFSALGSCQGHIYIQSPHVSRIPLAVTVSKNFFCLVLMTFEE